MLLAKGGKVYSTCAGGGAAAMLAAASILSSTFTHITHNLVDDSVKPWYVCQQSTAAVQACNTCLWCIGVTSSGLNEAEYTKITHDTTLAAAKVMVHPGMTFVYVSAEGADSSGTSTTMWARVKVCVSADMGMSS
jgi:hypothetical protein